MSTLVGHEAGTGRPRTSYAFPDPAGPSAPRASRSAAVLLALTAVLALLLGQVLAEVGLRFGPVMLLGLSLIGVTVPVALRRPQLLVVVLALSLPVGPLAFGPLEVVQLMVALLSLSLLVMAAVRRSIRLPPWPIAVPLVGFGVAAVVATPQAAIAEVAFNLDVQLALSLLLVVAVVTALHTRPAFHQATVALVLAGGLIAAWALTTTGPTETYYGGAVVTGRADGVFSQPNELGLVSTGLFVLAVGMAPSVTRRAARVAVLLSGALLLAALGASLSRGAWIGAAAGLVALVLLSPPARRSVVLLVGGGVVATFVATVIGSGVSTAVVDRIAGLAQGSANPYDQRGLIWAEGLRQFGDAPFTGQGPGGYPAAAVTGSLRSGLLVEAEHAHNLILTTAAEHGLIGLVSLVGLMLALLVLGLRARTAFADGGSPDDAVGVAALIAALVAVATHGMLDYPLRNATAATTVWLLVALLTAAIHRAGAGRFTPRSEDPRT